MPEYNTNQLEFDLLQLKYNLICFAGIFVDMYLAYKYNEANIACSVPCDEFKELDLIENEINNIELNDQSFTCSYQPFEIKTFKLIISK